MTFFSPLYLILILGLIPLILMYLLKKQHEDIVLSSNYLWNKMLRDIEANKPWQKLKNNLLMILQILLFTLIVFALARPQVLSGTINSEKLIIVLDKSASMKNKDIDGLSRFETAKVDIENLIKNTKSNTSTTLISMDTKASILISNSKDKNALKKKLNEIEANDSRDNVKDTLSLVRALVRDTDEYNVVFFTDKTIDTDLANFQVNKINGAGINVSLDNISSSESKEDISALATVSNHSNLEQSFDISLYGDEEIVDVEEIKLKAKESKDIYFENIDKSIGILKAEIDIDDSLDTDNSRYLVLKSDPINKVLIISEGGNVFLERAVEISENTEVYKSNEKLPEDLKGYDLYIFDGKLPKDIPKDGNIVIFNPKSNDLFNVSDSDESGEIKISDDDLFKYVNLDFYIDKTNTIESTKWLRPILTLNDKSIIAKGIKDNQKMVVVGFDIRNTDLPLKMDFPIFIQNILDYTLNINTQEKSEVLAGENIDINILAKSRYVNIINPKGEKEEITSPLYSNTSHKGLYTIEQVTDDESLKSYFVSNIDTSQESLDISESHGGNTLENDNENKSRSGKDIRNILLILALIIISFEWVVYNRGY